MSIKGSNFDNQTMTAAEHRDILEHIFSDGILSGCDFNVTGYDVLLTPGIFITSGGVQNVLATQTFSFELSSGYGRVISTLDMSAASTAQSWLQQSFTVEYSETLEGFDDLIQEDINHGGTIYQVEMVVVELGETGIASIVRKLGSV